MYSKDVSFVQSYIQVRITNVYNSVNGFSQLPEDPLAIILTRQLITRWACDSRHSECNLEGATLYNEWQQTPDPDTTNPYDNFKNKTKEYSCARGFLENTKYFRHVVFFEASTLFESVMLIDTLLSIVIQYFPKNSVTN
jgi:hypothetical protein